MSLTRLLVDGTEIQGEVGAKIQAVLDKYDKERKRRLLVDGEVVIIGGRFIDPDMVEVRPEGVPNPSNGT